MRRFLIKCAVFMILGLFYMLANYSINRYFIQTVPLIENHGRVLIVGDSHTKRALDPEILGSADNVSQLAEPYYVTYYKLRHLLDRAENVDTVMVLFSYHSISSAHDHKLRDEPWRSQFFNQYYMLSELPTVTGVPVGYDGYLKILIRRMCLYPSLRHDDLLGKYSNADEMHLGNHEIVAARHFLADGKQRESSKVAVYYLRKIISLCRERDVRPILVTTPMHKDYLKLVPPSFVAKFEALKEEFSAAGVELWDDGHAEYADREFYDADHLNSSGALRFSRITAERLREIIPESESRADKRAQLAPAAALAPRQP